MSMEHISTHHGNYHHGFPKTKESYSEKENTGYGRPHAGGPQDSIRGSTQNVRGEMEGRYDKYAKDGKFDNYGAHDKHDRHDRDVYTQSRHNEHKDYTTTYTIYTSKGAVKAGPPRDIVSDYALVAKDAKQKVLEAFEAFAKSPSDENRAKLEEAMIHRYKASEAFNKIKPSHHHHHWHGNLTIYRQEIKTPAARPTYNVQTVYATKPKSTLSPAEVTAAARDVLRNAYSSRRDGEAGIKEIRAEAYKLYVNALSEEFKATGKIAHTNNTPSTPVHHHHYHHGQVNLTYYTKIKDDTFRNLQDIVNKEKGGKWTETSGTRKNAFDSHIDSLAQWLKAGGRSPYGSILVSSIRIIQPIKIINLARPSFGNFGHGQHLKVINHRRDDDRHSQRANHHRDDVRIHTERDRNHAEGPRKSVFSKAGDVSRRAVHHKQGN